ncbi:pleckstrin homology domain-containing family S member 1-like [Fundulus diaphanus]
MAKREKNSGRAVFYKPITEAEQIRCGYLYKSPPKKALKLEWKKRYFVLFKTNDQNYQLRYFRSAEEKGQALGGIDLTQISLMYGNPQHHQKWIWVQKTFKCSPSCVLYIRAGNRDYFLVGETSTEVDGWFNDLCKAMEYRPHKYLSKEEISNGQPAVDIITAPLQRRKYSAPEVKALLKTRSVSDPPSNEVEGDTEKEQETSKRPVSEPLGSVYYQDYDYPRSFLKAESVGNDVTQAPCTESMYETMLRFKITHDAPAANNREVEQILDSTLMRSITQVYDKFKSPPPFPISEEAPFEAGEDKRHSSDFSSSSSGANSPVDLMIGQEKQDDSESSPEKRDFMVMQSDLKTHLTLTDVEGKPSVSGWTGQPQSVCLFHKGDQVLAINDLHTSTVEEVNMFITKSMKNEVKVTILRQQGRQPLHLPNSPCSD